MSQDKLESFDDLFRLGAQYLYDAEKQLTQALPKVAAAAASPDLRTAFEEHLHETEQHVARLEKICSAAGFQAEGKANTVMQAMVREAEGMIASAEPSPLLDAGLIVAANQIEHFEIGSYGALRTFAELLGDRGAVRLLDETLMEEKRADERLTAIAESGVNRQAAERRLTPAR